MVAQALPPEPEFLYDPSKAVAVRLALQKVYETDPTGFTNTFCSQVGGTIDGWESLTNELDYLQQVGLIQCQDKTCFRAGYFVIPWRGAFYLSDFPDSGHREEVFSPTPSTKFFSTLLQVQPNDYVLDLGTGNGLLLLEAARHGALGIGIDISDRALAFAKANANLNGLNNQVVFRNGNITSLPSDDEWGEPTVIICNPPFEPVPPSLSHAFRPLHSDGGTYGTRITDDLLSVIMEWSQKHRPRLIQMLLLSLGKKEMKNGEHLLLLERLRTLIKSLNASLDVYELLRPIKIEDYAVLNFEDDRGIAKKWTDEGVATLHLLLTNFFLAQPLITSTSTGTIRWVPNTETWQDDEFFLWPLFSDKRRRTGDCVVDTESLAGRHLLNLVEAREYVMNMLGKQVDLGLNLELVQLCLKRLLRDNSLFGSKANLIIVDLWARKDDNPVINGGLLLSQNPPRFFSGSQEELKKYAEQVFGSEASLAMCTVHKTTPYIRVEVNAGSLISLLETAVTTNEDTSQRFFIISPRGNGLTPTRQILFSNLQSELAGIAQAVKWRRSFDSYSVAHPLKHRLSALKSSASRLSREYKKKNDISSRIANHDRLASQVYSFAELSHLLHFSLTQGSWETLATKSQGMFKFAETEALDLTELIVEIINSCRPGGVANNQSLNLSNALPSYIIKPYFKVDNDTKVRLKDELYREVFYEIFGNALVHSLGDQATSLVEVDQAIIRGLPAITVSNDVSDGPNQVQIEAADWREWHRTSPTGLSFVANTLRATDAGKLFYRNPLLAGENKRRFSVALLLRGLAFFTTSNGGASCE